MLRSITIQVEKATGLSVGVKKKSPFKSPSVFYLIYTDVKYHNQSSFEMADNSQHIDEEEKKREEERRKKEE